MADLSQVIRWQAGLVRGLAQSVLERARAIRSSLPPPFQAADLPPPVRTVSTAKVRSTTKTKAAGAKKVVRKATPKRKSLAKIKKLK